jgi:hypothetical protein
MGVCDMARPVYVLFAESGSVDQHTNKVSMFDILESIDVLKAAEITGKSEDISQTPNPVIVRKTNPYRLVATWMREDGEADDDLFETEVVCETPNGARLFHTPVFPFSFGDKQLHRLYIPEVDLPGFTELGSHVIEARLRRAGQEEWPWRQHFPFLVREKPKAQPTQQVDPKKE